MDRPPLALSPRRLRPRRPPPGAFALSAHLPPATSKKRPPLSRSSVSLSSPPRPPQPPILEDLTSVVDIVKEHSAIGCDQVAAAVVSPSRAGPKSPLFERGRFYDLYSARRNERLKRKICELSEPAVAAAEDPGVAVELAKRRVAKKVESARKSLPDDFSARRMGTLRSSLRSSKEMKKAASTLAATDCSAAGVSRTGTRSLRRL
ncbi:uncharacterized protein LOC121968590 [Zingiber officinale]|uniref:Uncharacterized protein n=1 Tax=Zingiber officinale TaxID=94328 RepID=A0A8J5HMZ8_ZINOF|nr:uncharacterized protein LOC121968590 [Zingiber officinale]KAG6519475.1 hypothetical protein ZIOFF_022969 [Zingiber officinale]